MRQIGGAARQHVAHDLEHVDPLERLFARRDRQEAEAIVVAVQLQPRRVGTEFCQRLAIGREQRADMDMELMLAARGGRLDGQREIVAAECRLDQGL
ncbi:hypothetical protein WDZ92_50185 [Nostoc sp. NIES-2111]